MTLRTGKGGQYRYYTCSIKARQGETGCRGRSIPMDKLDNLVAGHIEDRLLFYSITSSTRNNTNESATVSPSAFAVLRLITTSNLVGNSTGRSAGLMPFRIRPA